MPVSDWLTHNSHVMYPFSPNADFTVSLGGGSESFPGKNVFSDAGFTAGIHSNFVPGQDGVYLDEWVITAEKIVFSFRIVYGGTYQPFECYHWVFEFGLDATLGTTEYAIATRRTGDITAPGPENPAMGMAFLTLGRLTELLALGTDSGYFLAQPEIEPARVQSDAMAFAEQLLVANEPRPCPPECPCDDSSSSSDSSLSSSSSGADELVATVPSSSSSSSSDFCTDPTPPEPSAVDAPERTPLPGGIFIGNVKLKDGYNCQITVDAARGIVTVNSGINLGAGEQCEDLRMDEDGSLSPESCLVCGGLLYAINGVGFDAEQLQLTGGPGVAIVPEPLQNRVIVRLEEEGICEVEV